MNQPNHPIVHNYFFRTVVLMLPTLFLFARTSGLAYANTSTERKFPIFSSSPTAELNLILRAKSAFLAAAVITTQPRDTAACSGSSVSFSLTTTNAVSFQWQEFISSWIDLKNASVYSGVTSPALTISSVTGLGGRQYRCIVTGASPPTETSNAAKLIEQIPYNIVSTTPSPAICAGNNASLAIHTTGLIQSYQWQLSTGLGFSNLSNSAPYSGTNTANMTINAANPPMDGYIYQCVVSGQCKAPSASTWDTLHVYTAPKIYLPPQDTALCVGTQAIFAIQALGKGMNFKWQEDRGAGFVTLAESGPYSGTKTPALSISGVQQIMDGNRYRCILTGTCSPADTSSAGTLYLNTPVLIYRQPNSTTICAGGRTLFHIRATGNNLTYQWQVNKGKGFADLPNAFPYSGANSDSLHLAAVIGGLDGNMYRCMVTNTCGPADSSLAAVLHLIDAPAFISHPVSSSICLHDNTTFTVKASGAGIAYQWQVSTGTGFADISDGLLYSGVATSTLTITAAGAAMNGYAYHCVITGACPPSDISNDAILHVGTPPQIFLQPQDTAMCSGSKAVFSIQAIGPGIAYQWQEDQGKGAGFVNLADMGSYSGTQTASVTINGINQLMDGYKYRCILLGTCSPAEISAAGTLYFNTPVLIYGQPDKAVVCAGSTTIFTVRATGNNLRYQWQMNQGTGFVDLKNAFPYSGVNTDSLTIFGVSATQDGFRYRCMVANTCSAADSSADAVLHILDAPSITTQPSDATACDGNAVFFTASAMGNGISYQWQINNGTGFVNLSDNTLFGGTTTNQLTVTGINMTMDGNLFRLSIAGTCSVPRISTSAMLSVRPIPQLAFSPTDITVCNGILVPARTFTSIPAGATINWTNTNTLIGLISGGKGATSVPAFVAQNTSSQGISALVTIQPRLSGCSGSSSSYTILVNPLPVVSLNLGSLDPVCSSITSIPLAGGSPAGGMYSGTAVSGGNFSPSAAGIGTFTMTYTYTDSHSCVNSTSTPIHVDVCTAINSITATNLQIEVYPVPFKDQVAIVLNQVKTDVQVELFSVNGQLITHEVFSGNLFEIETRSCASGIYYLRIVTNEGLTIRKIMKN
jgi:hypothetical protein